MVVVWSVFFWPMYLFNYLILDRVTEFHVPGLLCNYYSPRYHALRITLLSCRNSRSQSCPFCRDNLKKTCPGDLWIYVEDQDVVDMETVSSENLRRLFMYISKLPLIVPDVIFSVYDSHIK